MADAQPAPKSSRPLGLILFFAVAGLNVAAGVVGLFLTYKATLGFDYKATTEADVQRELASDSQSSESSQPMLFAMEPFMANLGGTPQRVIRLEMSLVMLDEEGFEEVMGLGGRTRDIVMRVLNQKSFSDIESLQGKLFLKDQIALALNSTLQRGVVKDVFFTDFVVQ